MTMDKRKNGKCSGPKIPINKSNAAPKGLTVNNAKGKK